jgi:hypothetical protein
VNRTYRTKFTLVTRRTTGARYGWSSDLGGTMKRTLAVVLAALALVLGAPAAQATTDGWCLVPGSDICRRYLEDPAPGANWCSNVTALDVPNAVKGPGPCT